MIFGISAGFTWALETVILGMALAMNPFKETEQAIFLAPFVCTFLHDLCSAIWACAYNTVRGNFKDVFAVLKTKQGRLVALGALLGGPIGMTGYILAVNELGASVGAIASAVYPAIGALLAFFFLKEKMPWYRWILLFITLLGVFGLSYSPSVDLHNFWLGLIGALMCSFGWGTEGVILAKSFQNSDMKQEYALQIRQSTSALAYGIVLLPALKGWRFTVNLCQTHIKDVIPLIALAAFFATVSYLCYYKSIAKIGASKSMALNISYVAWAMIFTVVILRDTSVVTPLTVACAAIVIVCGVLSSAEFKRKSVS